MASSSSDHIGADAPSCTSPILRPVDCKTEFSDADAPASETRNADAEALAESLLRSGSSQTWPWQKKTAGKARSAPKAKAKAGKARNSPKAKANKTKKAKSATSKAKKKRVSRIARLSDYKRKGWAYRLVKLGKKEKTPGGLRKKDLIFNKQGRVVSKKRSQLSKTRFARGDLGLWKDSLMEIRNEHDIQGFKKMKKEGDASEKQLLNQVHARWNQKLLAKAMLVGGA